MKPYPLTSPLLTNKNIEQWEAMKKIEEGFGQFIYWNEVRKEWEKYGKDHSTK